ncbi:hypothetical protein [Streptomyces acidiscabies]|uniref:hypothetical protein n=1 Tax=Streptomyces acidiscabies TaxID=42234 RepID=UPI0038F6A9C2
MKTRSTQSASVSSGADTGKFRNSGMCVRSAPSSASLCAINSRPALASPAGPSQAGASLSRLFGANPRSSNSASRAVMPSAVEGSPGRGPGWST